MKYLQWGPSIEVSQERAIEELEEIPVEKIKEDLPLYSHNACQVQKPSGTDKGTQFPVLLQVSRCASRAASPTNWWRNSSQQAGETTQVEASETSVLATHRTVDNNWVSWCLLPKTMQMDILREAWQYFWQNCESIFWRMVCHVEVLLTTKVKTLREPYSQQNVAELHSFIKCCGSCQFLRGLWIDMSGDVAEIHMRIDAKNLVTTARRIH